MSSFTFDGVRIESRSGDTISAALARAGIVALGRRRDGTPRGMFCGMGVCQECVVTVDGAPSRRACMMQVADGMAVTSQDYAPALPEAVDTTSTASMTVERPQVLVVGAGPAGLSAACAAARCGATVTVLDERAKPGGQYFKQRVDADAVDAQMREGRELIAQVSALGVKVVPDAEVWGAFGPRALAATVSDAATTFAPERLVLATGAYERGVPVPGWTLPGFMTTGAAQTLLRAHDVAPGRRVLVAGNGPLNFQLAAELLAAGVDVVAVAEAGARPSPWQHLDLARAAWAAPSLIKRGMGYVARINRARVPIHYQSVIVAAEGKTRVESCTIGTKRVLLRYEVDVVCAGYGFLPSNEIARALGCRHRIDAEGRLATVVSDDGSASIAGVYAIGDMVGLRGAYAAQAQGWLTGCAVAQSLGLALPREFERAIDRSRRRLARDLSFQRALWSLFAAPVLHASLATHDTIVCRCENVTRASIESAIAQGATSLGEVKRRTRAGMGRCQGRYCESIVATMLPGSTRDERFGFAPRAPIKPIRIKDVV
jgi:NADPH-dependent 2,4-dienoyl-CoA reductase/sulfur reductase-like enzyme